MSNPTFRNVSSLFLIIMASTATAVDLCTGKNAEDCKIRNTARLTWTLLGVLMLINFILFCMLCCTWYYLWSRMRDLRRKVGVVSAASHSRAVHNSHIFVNRNSENRLSGVPNSASEPTALSAAHNKPLIAASGDYSVVFDAIKLEQPQERKHSVSNMKRLKKSTLAVTQSVHPFSSSVPTNSVGKTVKQKRPLRVAPPIPIVTAQVESNPSASEHDHSYAHIVDGFSQPEDADSAFSSDPRSPPHATARTTTSTHSTTSAYTSTTTTTTTATTATVEEVGDVYSTPIPNGIKNYRRMTASQNKDALISKSKSAKRERYNRPQSALGLYPPLDDIYTSSCPSSPVSIRRKNDKPRPVSAYEV